MEWVLARDWFDSASGLACHDRSLRQRCRPGGVRTMPTCSPPSGAASRADRHRAVVWRGPPLSRYDAVIMAAAVTAEIERLVDLIVAEAHPLRVILFGSSARGDATPGSDIDLLVVMPDGTHRLHTMQRLYGRIRGVAVPFDILVATTADLEARGEALGLIYRDALREGKELYAA